MKLSPPASTLIFILTSFLHNLAFVRSIEMCGRLFLSMNLAELRRISRSGIVRHSTLSRTSFNVAPTSNLPIIRRATAADAQLNDDLNENTSVAVATAP